MNADKLMDAVGNIGGDLIAEYAQVRPAVIKGKESSKRKRTVKVWLSSAAAAAVLAVGIFAAAKLMKRPDDTHSATAPTAAPTQTAEVTPEGTPAVTPAPTQDIDCRLLVLPGGALGELDLSYVPDIPYEGSMTVDKNKVGDRKTIEFAGRTYELEYEYSFLRVVGNTVFEQYAVTGGGALDGRGRKCFARFLPDGTLYELVSCPIVTVDIGPGESGESIRGKVMEALKDEIDFSGYEKSLVTEPSADYPDGLYRFCWYKEKAGFMRDDTILISVYADTGEVCSVGLKNAVDMGLDDLPDDIDANDYLPLIEAKLNEIFGGELVEYELSGVGGGTCLTNIWGSPCLRCELQVSVRAGDSIYHGLCYIAAALQPDKLEKPDFPDPTPTGALG